MLMRLWKPQEKLSCCPLTTNFSLAVSSADRQGCGKGHRLACFPRQGHKLLAEPSLTHSPAPPLPFQGFETAHCFPVQKEMAPHSSTLAWKIPWMEDPGGLNFMGLQRVRHERETSLSLLLYFLLVLKKHKLESRLQGKISTTSVMQMVSL